MFKSHRLVYHPTIGWRVKKKTPNPKQPEVDWGAGFKDRLGFRAQRTCGLYRGTSLVRNTHPPRITIGP